MTEQMSDEERESREAERQTWQYRAVEATRGNTSRLGCLVLAVIGRNARHPPWIETGLTIYPDGNCYADVVDKEYIQTTNMHICHVDDLKANFRGLADALKLSDEDRTAMFDELRKFILKDMRAEDDVLKGT